MMLDLLANLIKSVWVAIMRKLSLRTLTTTWRFEGFRKEGSSSFIIGNQLEQGAIRSTEEMRQQHNFAVMGLTK